MLQETFDRVSGVVPASQILVVTEQSHAQLIRDQLPEIPRKNILVEPMRRGTGPAIGWAAVQLLKRDPDAVMAVFASDHVIVKRDEFRSVLLLAAEVAASSGMLLTFGIEPSAPSTEFGYIHRGEQHSMHDGRPVYRVESFKEKPNAARAQEFVDSGEYFWNAGMFCWKASAIMDEISRYIPDLHRGLQAILSAIGTSEERTILEEVYPTLPKDTIDYAVLEKASDVLVVPADIGWSDVGTWSALLDVMPGDANGNVVLAGTELMAIDTKNSLIYSPHRLVATIGVSDMVIIDTDSALLVCSKEQAGQVKRIVEQLEAQNRTEYL